MIRAIAPKWIALGGGGYDIANVARAWTLAWAIMNDVAALDQIPEVFLRKYPGAGFQNQRLMDDPFIIEGRVKEGMRKEVNRVIEYIKEHIIRKL